MLGDCNSRVGKETEGIRNTSHVGGMGIKVSQLLRHWRQTVIQAKIKLGRETVKG